ncbi:MAG TPA: toll/interleukin-1 receptor domain-containing protein, partial [Flavobacterium sp.]|nr:toll/interleukin-1 receptor domain-containing protein [Flavobacterium sp.]
RELAELIFDTFRKANCKTNQIVMMRSINFGVINNLNPKEKEMFYTVLNGLIFTGYYTYHADSPECIRLTEKGYDYIYDDEMVQDMLKKPWIIPDVNQTDWDKAFYKLWKVIGPQDTASNYISGTQFYKFIMELCDDLPPSYSIYIEQRRKKDLSTSRVEYYNDLINHLDEEKRKELYVNIQLFLEGSTVSKNTETDEVIFETTLNETISIEDKKTEPKSLNLSTTESPEVIPSVFISYSWDSQEHEDWIVNLATKLCDNGVNAILDKWDLGPLGKPLPHFMENSITKSQRVICVMTPNYKKKTENLAGGVGYEYSIISADIFTNGVNTSKFIPLFRSGTSTDAIPTVLNGRKYVDMRDDSNFEDKFLNELLRDIHEEPKFKKPTLGKKPKFD